MRPRAAEWMLSCAGVPCPYNLVYVPHYEHEEVKGHQTPYLPPSSPSQCVLSFPISTHRQTDNKKIHHFCLLQSPAVLRSLSYREETNQK